MADLVEFADTTAASYQSGHASGEVSFCAPQSSAFDAYLLVLKAPDRPPYDGSSFYRSAIVAEDDLATCQYNTSEMTSLEAIQSLTSGLDLYPHEDALAEAQYEGALKVFDYGSIRETTLGAILALKSALETGFDGWDVNVGTHEDESVMVRLQRELCGEVNSNFLTGGVAADRKIMVCPSTKESYGLVVDDLSSAGLLAASAADLHYTLEFSLTYPYGTTYACDAYDENIGGFFNYTKPGQFDETFTLVDITTGNVASQKTYKSSTPKCCVSGSHSSGDWSVITSCNGGRDPSSTFSESSLTSWLEAAAR